MVGNKQNTQERSDRILEPLQVVIQLALLSFCPTGTKLCIQDNILSLQLPTFSQGVWRWYNKDSKEDLYFLFSAVKRYYIWYKEESYPFFSYILELSKKGIAKLIQTYQKTDKAAIGHVLGLYQALLDSDGTEIFKDTKNSPVDKIFKNIKLLYNKKLLISLYNIFQLMEIDAEYKDTYYKSIQILLSPINKKIQTWIHEQLLVK